MLADADIVIYGGSFSAVSAAVSAAEQSPDSTIVVIVTDPVTNEEFCLGSIGTLGGQNYFDVRKWNGEIQTRGSYMKWEKNGRYYNTNNMAKRLQEELMRYPNISILCGYDVRGIFYTSPFTITGLRLQTIYRDDKGVVQWGTEKRELYGTVFIDASDTGRLTQQANFGGTVGRHDWPAVYLEVDEQIGQARQQAATLMFQVRYLDVTAKERIPGTLKWRSVFQGIGEGGVWRGNGGKLAYERNKKIQAFNDTWGPKGFAIKPFNVAQNGSASAEYWVNALLVFNVDGRANERDRGTRFFPKDMRADYKTTDQAWVEARKVIGSAEFIEALQELPGFAEAEIVRDANGDPVVGAVLYLRETIHAAQDSGRRSCGTENENYALRTDDCNEAGASAKEGEDARLYSSRMGLNYYWSDINAYQFSDLKDMNGTYIWSTKVGMKLRPDLNTTTKTPLNPVYIPYSALASNFVSNLLTAGYSACMSSFAWAEARVIPNLCVLGDAAGTAAAYAINNEKTPQSFSPDDIVGVQTMLRSRNAKLYK